MKARGSRRHRSLEQESGWLPLASAVPLLLMLAVVAVFGSLSLWSVVAIVLSAMLAYGAPDSGRGLVALALAVAVWLFAGPHELSVGSLIVALLLLIAHTALALRAIAPPAVEYGADVLRRWLLRCAAVAGVPVVVYVAAVAIGSLPHGSSGAIVAAGLALIAALVLVLRSEILQDAADSDP